MGRLTTRRELLRAGAAGGATLGLTALGYNSLISRALATSRSCAGATLNDIEHFVILIQENRSFDHYFGTYRGVIGFADPHVLPLNDGSGLRVFAQPGYPGGYRSGHLYPFHIDSYSNGECTNDIDHSWGPQHTYWNGGKLDSFVTGHLKADGAANGPLTMGYFARATTCRSTTPLPTLSLSATTITARSSAPRTPTVCIASQPGSTRQGPRAGRSSRPARPASSGSAS